MRKWLTKSINLYKSDPASSDYQYGFLAALIQVQNELDRRAEDRKILILKLAVVGVLAAVVIGVGSALFG